MPNSSGSNGLRWREWSEDVIAACGSPLCAVDEGKRVVTEREVRAEIDRLLELDQRLILAAAQPQRPAHRPMRGRIAIVGHEALPGGLDRRGRFPARACAQPWNAFCQCVKDRPA